MKARHLFFVAILFILRLTTSIQAQQHHHGDMGNGDTLQWRMPMAKMTMPMLPGMHNFIPPMTPFLPGMGMDASMFPLVQPRKVYELSDGDTLTLEAKPVRRTIYHATLIMYGFNGQHPGPLIRVKQKSTIIVDFTNNIDLPTTIHWHGIRIENQFDGVPGLTQEPVQPGERFIYKIHFRDAGIYWYHPHVREDIQQELGLYGNILVDSDDPEYFNPVNKEEVVIFDDILLDGDQLVPFGKEASNYTLMGRFGNLFLVNGEPEYKLALQRGEVVRFMLTNVSNTRTNNLVMGRAKMKIVGADISKFEREEWVSSVVLAPAQRYIVEARFDKPGRFALTNQVQALDHFMGQFYPSVDTLGHITVSDTPVETDYSSEFNTLRENHDVIAEIDPFRKYFNREPDHELKLTVKIGEWPQAVLQFMSIDTSYYPPVEWSDSMPMMNWISNAQNLTWILHDLATGKENMDIVWNFELGEVAMIRLFNDPKSLHPMSHPIHLHGQRFLVVSTNGVRNQNLAWKDTVLVPVGTRVDILLEASNPGKWMLHCHIAEHLGAGMMSVFHVNPLPEGNK
jgi:FtsP/CotA-like multicopper oxidase with cupredoxin domain